MTTTTRPTGDAGSTAAGSGAADAPPSVPPGKRGDRKTQVLTSHTASHVESIAGAVVIKDGEPFFLCPPDGQLAVDGEHGYGFYQHDTRYLAGYRLTVAGIAPNSLAATTVTGDHAELELTMPAIRVSKDRTIGKQQLAVRWSRELDGAAVRLRDRITIRNHDRDGARLPVHLAFAADFLDVFAIRGLLDERPGAVHDPTWDDGRLTFRYDGKDGVVRSLDVSIHPAPERTDGAACDVTLDVPGRGETAFTVELAIHEEVAKGAPPIERRTGSKAGGTTGASGEWQVAVTSDSLTFDSAMDRSLQDLLALRSELDGERYYAAGIPWFSTLFGRDSLIAAYQTLAFDPTIAAETLRLLARRQGTTDDSWRDEEPGKILHELRIGELARLDEIPHTPYYGSIDSTPLFLLVLARHADWTGSLDVFQELQSNVERALDWIDRSIAHDERGFLAYGSTTKHGLANQGWKDSGDAIVTGDGSIASPPIALAEVQGYVFAAWQALAGLYERTGDGERATELRGRATDLQKRFEAAFWSDDLGCYVLALERDGRPCEVVASNAGQVLWTGIAGSEHAARVADRLLQDDMFSGWGVRTLSNDAVAANPIGYHLGTVWPHDNGIIAEGLRRYGHREAAGRIFVGLIEAAADFPDRRLPECFAGFDRQEFGIPVRYPVACHPQAWAAGSVPHLLTTALGLVPEALDGRLRVVRPDLPEFLEHLEVTGLRVGGACVDLAVDRADGGTAVAVRHVEGDLDVIVEP